MAKAAILEDDFEDLEDLTEEGKAMWANISRIEKIMTGESLFTEDKKTKSKKMKVNPLELSIAFFRLEIKRLIKNSELVIQDCDKILAKLKTKEEYLTCDARVAKSIHTNFIIRLKNVLEYKQAFDHEIEIDEDTH